MDFSTLIFEPLTNLAEPLLVYFALVTVLDYIRSIQFGKGG